MKNIKQVAEQFHVSAQTVRTWVRSGELKCFRVKDICRFSDEHIKDFIAENEKHSA